MKYYSRLGFQERASSKFGSAGVYFTRVTVSQHLDKLYRLRWYEAGTLMLQTKIEFLQEDSQGKETVSHEQRVPSFIAACFFYPR